MKGIDCTGRPGGKNIKDAGFEFVCRYVSNSAWKNLSLEEAKDLHDNGLKIVLVWETSEQRPLESFDAGVIDGTLALQMAKNLGCSSDRPIYFACDFDFKDNQQLKINKYFEGINSVIPVSGIYGGYYVVKRTLDAGLCKFSWQTSAWSHGQWDLRANIRQISYNTVIVGPSGNVVCDENISMTDDFGQW